MKKFLVITHGEMALGLKNTLSMFIDVEERYNFIGAYLNEENVDVLVDEVLNNISIDDEVIVFSDILGGSVNQKIMVKLNQYPIHLIAGVNLPMLITASVLEPNEPISESDIKQIIDEGQKGIIYVNNYLKQLEFSDEDE